MGQSVELTTRPFVVVGIPAHNEARTIGGIVAQARRHADLVLVCDDGSSDQTALAARNAGAFVSTHEVRIGYGGALRTLFRLARQLNASALVTIDGDAQHDPAFLPSVLKPILTSEANIVVGSRFLLSSYAKRIPLPRRLGIAFISKLLTLLTGLNVSDAQCGYRCYDQKAITDIDPQTNGMGASTEILVSASKLGLRITEVPMYVEYRGIRKSSQSTALHFISVVIMTAKAAFSAKRLMQEDEGSPLQASRS